MVDPVALAMRVVRKREVDAVAGLADFIPDDLRARSIPEVDAIPTTVHHEVAVLRALTNATFYRSAFLRDARLTSDAIPEHAAFVGLF